MTSVTSLCVRLLLPLLLSTGIFALKMEKHWTYTLLDMETNSTNEDIAKIEVHLARIGRGDYAVSGNFHIGILVDKSVDLEVEIVVYRSPDGSAEYKLQPFGVQRQSLFTTMDHFYKNFLMKSVKDCSNLPQYEGELTELGPIDYKMDKCKISTEAFPNYVPEGFYKFYFVGYGIVNFTWYVHFKLERL